MKRWQALIAATIVTGLVAFGMLVVGLNAFFNTNSVKASDAAVSVTAPTGAPQAASAPSVDQTQLTQLQSLIAQYQDREKQYQAQLNQLNGELQQYQQVLTQLQQQGLIQVTQDGQILVGRSAGREGRFGSGLGDDD